MSWIKWTRLWHKGYPNGYTVCGIRVIGIKVIERKTCPDDLGIVCYRCRRSDDKTRILK